ncbi:MAG TPA: hypothetical protein DCG69_04335 [Bacteroidales bacterium]|nr:hypothetical protein [Bacteroidales bacterium]
MNKIIALIKLSKIGLWLFMAGMGVFFACSKEPIIITDSSVKLAFSNDTITFDTIFTTMGSVTKQLKVYNKEKNTLLISKIALAGGTQSPYQINVNGHSGTVFNELELAGGDSLFVFVRITIDPNNQNSPLIVRDSVLFELNGKIQDVDLYAWGQDAHYILPNLNIEGLPPLNIIAREGETVNWTNDKPYVIVGYAVVDSLATLKIEAGTRIHFYNKSGMWIYKGGSIQVDGTKENSVTFQGTRLESDYQNLPAQWDRIWINESKADSYFNYAIIKNGTIGIQAETLTQSLGNTLFLTNTKIVNMSGWGLFTRFYKIEANTILVANTGSSVLNLTTGGSYSFKNSTFANYYSYAVRKDPLLHLSNYFIYSGAQGDIVYNGILEKAYFGDCVFYGTLDEEILIDPFTGTENDFPYLFDYCLLKSSLTGSLQTNESIFNRDPLFVAPYDADFSLETDSPVIDKGIFMGNIFDLDGNSRDLKPDLGAYEYFPPPTKWNKK